MCLCCARVDILIVLVQVGVWVRGNLRLLRDADRTG